jgi:CO/xanthine dehydrogenase Mo-binding subunit
MRNTAGKEVTTIEALEKNELHPVPGVPPFVAACCNATYAATGKRARDLPITELGLS